MQVPVFGLYSQKTQEHSLLFKSIWAHGMELGKICPDTLPLSTGWLRYIEVHPDVR